ncbi:MAG: o-succinylbenzoate synthase [Cyclobacteriaceae bacterium]|jgi:O-succinylbenzoate synthase
MLLTYQSFQLDFSFAAGTSRGVMHQRFGWYLSIQAHDTSPFCGKGEVAPLPGLSDESIEEIPDFLAKLCDRLKQIDLPQKETSIFELAKEMAESFPSIRFGLEMAMLDALNGGKQKWFSNPFARGEIGMPINGLIWMGEVSEMKKQIEEKLEQKYECIKMKIGALDFEEELKILAYVRGRFDGILRVDANGAFSTSTVFRRLEQLAVFDLHSIEQPIMPRQRQALSLVCQKSPVPVALDEELIGIADDQQKATLLDEIMPPYIILKPSLLGGFMETATWIRMAEERNIGWWITSALESNLGLDAIAQFAAEYNPTSHQGLGTGGLFTNNLPATTTIKQGRIWHL